MKRLEPYTAPGKKEAVRAELVSTELLNKLAAIVKQVVDVNGGTRTIDTVGMNSALDDAEVQHFLDQMDKASRLKPFGPTR